MAQNADEAASRSRPVPVTAGEESGFTIGGEMPTGFVLAGVGAMILFLILVCLFLYVILSLAANQPFTDIMFGTPGATP